MKTQTGFNKFTAWLLTLAMLMTFIPALAAEEAEASAPCGHNHTDWTPFTAETVLGSGSYYYLTGDIALSSSITAEGVGYAYLCTNGHTLTAPDGAPAVTVSDGSFLFIYGNGTISGDESCPAISVTGGFAGITDGITVNSGKNGTAFAISGGNLDLKKNITVNGAKTLDVTGGSVAIDAGVQLGGSKSATGGTFHIGTPLPEGTVIPEGVTVCVYSISAAVPFGSAVALANHVTVTRYTGTGSSAGSYGQSHTSESVVLDADGNFARGLIWII